MRHVTLCLPLFFLCGACSAGPATESAEVATSTDDGSRAQDRSGETTPVVPRDDEEVPTTSDVPTEPPTPEDPITPPRRGPGEETPQTEPVQPAVCSGNVEGTLQSFGGACCYTAEHAHNADCVWYSDAFQESGGSCLDGQCATGSCLFGTYCSRNCTVYEDKVNNATSLDGVDGINDPGVIDDCAGAVDGPMGSEFHCVNQASVVETSWGVCRPGTTFAQCDTDADCPGSEVCGPFYVLGQVESRCQAGEKQTSEIGEPCNSDPNLGPIQHCASGFCYGGACVGLCETGDDCTTDTCVEGTCSKNADQTCTVDTECSAFQCVETAPFASNPYTHPMCMPKGCLANADCSDPDWFCRPFWNGALTVEDVAYAPACLLKDEDTASYGDACGLVDDGSELPPCVWEAGCLDNHCAGPCQSQADCPTDTECLHAYQWELDLDQNSTVDTYLNLDACQVWAHDGDLADCTQDADCAQGAHCAFRLVGSGDGDARTWRAEYKCRAHFDTQVGWGESCSQAVSERCASNLCLEVADKANTGGVCSTYCSQASDCAGDDATLDRVCESVMVTGQNNMAPEDDVYVAHCSVTPVLGSLASCEATRSCADPAEYCRAHAIAGNPEEPATVEHLCVANQQDPSAPVEGTVGASCATDTECRGRTCIVDSTGLGYCSELCLTDADCQSPDGLLGLTCTEETLVPRLDPGASATTKRCLL